MRLRIEIVTDLCEEGTANIHFIDAQTFSDKLVSISDAIETLYGQDGVRSICIFADEETEPSG